MSNYVYIRSETSLYTVGFYSPDGNWHPESDYNEAQAAAARVAFLNGDKGDKAQPAPADLGLADRIGNIEANYVTRQMFDLRMEMEGLKSQKVAPAETDWLAKATMNFNAASDPELANHGIEAALFQYTAAMAAAAIARAQEARLTRIAAEKQMALIELLSRSIVTEEVTGELVAEIKVNDTELAERIGNIEEADCVTHDQLKKLLSRVDRLEIKSDELWDDYRQR
jgi:hypothetical protein